MTFVTRLKSRIRNALLPKGFAENIDALRLQQGRVHARAIRYEKSTRLQDWEFQVFSQWGEDGVIQKLISEVQIEHRTFIEFGVEDFNESNCRFLMMNNHWSGFVIEGAEVHVKKIRSAPWFWKYDLRAHHAFLTRDNINEILALSGFDFDLGVLSVDVDGNDYWILEAIANYRPRILVLEYNANFGGSRCISVPYDPKFARFEHHYSGLYYGASLGALTHLANSKGYALVGTERAGVNAFFVRRDVLPSHIPEQIARDVYTPSAFRPARNESGRLTWQRAEEQIALLRGLPVVNVQSGLIEKF